MYTHILVPISFDSTDAIETALKAARLLASADAEITLLHVVEEMPRFAVSYVPQEFLKEAHTALATELQNLAKEVKGAHGLVVDGHAGQTIVDYANRTDVDCIVIASHRPGMQDLLIGSTAARVVRHAQCAVHVLR